jgi:nitrite reductase (cytochrome c-552)
MEFLNNLIQKIERRHIIIAIGAIVAVSLFIYIIGALGPSEPKLVLVGSIPDNEYDPEEWGKVYPLEYESWKKTQEPRPAGKSFYKKGWDTDKVFYDKLSEYPFMALLFKGWGFGIAYFEPRGHWYMRIDQDEIDQLRTKAGGVCLNCKSPYMDALVKQYGDSFYSMKWQDAIAKIPTKHKDLGATCIDCHDNKTMGLKINREAFKKGLAKLGKKEFSRQEMRILVCAQCHVTYNIPKNANMQSVGLEHPYEGSSWGNISIENIIKLIKKNAHWGEWKQEVTGFKVGFLRHPEFEFFTRQSVHFNAGLACADCHMPYKRVGSFKISDHNVMSPLKDDLFACLKCHPQSKERLVKQVKEIQDRTLSLLLKAGYHEALVAKLFECVHSQYKDTLAGDPLYVQAKDFYLEALYRLIFMGAENSIGFHNPEEAGRILGDSIGFSTKAEGLLRQLLAKKGVDVGNSINLELAKYLNNRGEHKLMFKHEQEFKDPFGIVEKTVPRNSLGL